MICNVHGVCHNILLNHARKKSSKPKDVFTLWKKHKRYLSLDKEHESNQVAASEANMTAFAALEKRLSEKADLKGKAQQLSSPTNERKSNESVTNANLSAFAALEQKLQQNSPQSTKTGFSMPRIQPPSMKPKPPLPEECCGSGCHNCVFVTYWEDLRRYENSKKGLDAS